MLESIRERFKAPGVAAAATIDGRLVAVGNAGVRGLHSNEAVGVGDRSLVGSCGKTWTRLLIARLAESIDAPLNIIAGPTSPSISELQSLGVARVSFGPRPMRAALSLVRKIAQELRREGTYSKLANVYMTYAEVNAMFEAD